jgi:hypothetical protein
MTLNKIAPLLASAHLQVLCCSNALKEALHDAHGQAYLLTASLLLQEARMYRQHHMEEEPHMSMRAHS